MGTSSGAMDFLQEAFPHVNRAYLKSILLDADDDVFEASELLRINHGESSNSGTAILQSCWL